MAAVLLRRACGRAETRGEPDLAGRALVAQIAGATLGTTCVTSCGRSVLKIPREVLMLVRQNVENRLDLPSISFLLFFF